MSDWHPILAARERTPAVWTMVDPQQRDYGTISLVRARPAPEAERELVYKCVRDNEVIGWTRTLRAACDLVHRHFITGHSPGVRPNTDW